MKKTKVLSLILTAVLATSVLAGCKKEEKQAGTNTETVSTEPITFKMFNVETNANWDNYQSPVAKELEKRTGVTLDVEYAVGDAKQKLSVMLAGGDYPDLIFAKGDQNLFIDAGAFLKLDDLIEKHGPNIKKMFGDFYPRLRYSKDDPSIYYVGSFEVKQAILTPQTRFWVQHAVVKELGYPQMKTVADLEKAVTEYAKKYPAINGQPTIPVTMLGDGMRALSSVTGPAAEATGGTNEGEWFVDQKTLTAKLHNTRPEEKEYYRWLNGLYNKGLLDKEVYLHKEDAYKAKIASGRVLSVIDAGWSFGDSRTALAKAGMEERMYGMYPIVLTEGTENRVNQTSGYTGGWGISITDKCKDPVRAIKFLDYLASEEGQILTHWGIEGTHWQYDANKKRQFLPEVQAQRKSDPQFSQKTGIGNYTYPFPQWGAVKDSTGNFVKPDSEIETVIANYTKTEKEVLAGYNAKAWMDLFPGPEKYPARALGAGWMYNLTDPDILAKFNKIRDDIGARKIPEAIMSKPDQFDGIWDAYMKEIDTAGRADVEAAFNKLLKEKLELWKK